VVPPAPTGRLAFVTVGKWLPAGGIAGADAVCASEASTAGLAGTFKAVLATASAGSLGRFSQAGNPWFRVDGVALTQTTAQMFDGQLPYLETSLNVTALGAYIIENPLFTDAVWTGPRLVGSTKTCTDWTSSASTDRGATAFITDTQINTELSESYPQACNVARRLFCFQQ
jgi:hypothetical protein